WMADPAANHGHALRAVAVQAPEAGGLLQDGQRSSRTGSHAVLRRGVPQFQRVRLRYRGPEERSRRRPLSHDGRRSTLRRGAMARLHQGPDRFQGPSGDRAAALGRRRSMEGLRVRRPCASGLGAGGSESRAAARRELHQQLEDAGTARRRGGHQVGHPVDGVAAGLSARVGGTGMNGADSRKIGSPATVSAGVVGAAVDGMRRVNRAPAILLGVFTLTLIVSVPLAVALRGMLAQQLGDSLIADSAAAGVNYDWMEEFADQATGLGVTFKPTIIGFAAGLGNLSAFPDNPSRPVVIVGAASVYILGWLFLAGGILDRFARDRPTRAHGFFAACGVFFFRFLRLATVQWIVYAVLFGALHPWLF